MRIDFEPTAEQRELVRSLATLVERRGLTGPLDATSWGSLGELGVLALGTDEGGGTVADLCVAAQALGRACAQGPLIGAVLGMRVLPDHAESIGAGATTVGVHDGGVIAWSDAHLVLDCSTPGEWWLAEPDDVVAFESLAGEPWARGTVRRVEPVVVSSDALAAAELARGSWMVGAGHQLVDLAATHAGERRQFGQPIGTFQGVAHPLAMAVAQLHAASDLIALGAVHLDADDLDVAIVDAARRTATDAALAAAYVSHQVHGAVGFSAERGLDRWSAAVRQLSHHPPAPSGVELIDLARRHG